MRNLLVTAASLSLALGNLAGVATAQEVVPGEIITNADGSRVTSTAGVNPTANGGGGTIIYGDITTGPGYTVIGPPSVEYVAPPPEPIAAEPAPVAEEAPVESAPVDMTVSEGMAAGSDLDGDNIADELEWNLGLDPNNADVDGDGVADGDEVNIYFTDPLNWDTDGDSVSDGEELFGIQTDPLVWNDANSEQAASLAQEAVESSQPVTTTAPAQTMAQETSENLTATDGDAAALGTGSASAAPGTVTRPNGTGGMALLGPDGTYTVTDSAPANVSVAGDTEVISPPLNTTSEPAATDPSSNIPACDWYGSWYDAQVAYESAGMTAADPALVMSLDPDYDGIACEEGMA